MDCLAGMIAAVLLTIFVYRYIELKRDKRGIDEFFKKKKKKRR